MIYERALFDRVARHPLDQVLRPARVQSELRVGDVLHGQDKSGGSITTCDRAHDA